MSGLNGLSWGKVGRSSVEAGQSGLGGRQQGSMSAEQRTRCETVLGDGRDGRNVSGRVRAKFLRLLVPNLERIFYFVESLRSAPFQPNTLKVERSRSVPPNATLRRVPKVSNRLSQRSVSLIL
jgi:hypothetical protein